MSNEEWCHWAEPDDFEEYNRNEADDYRNEADLEDDEEIEDQWVEDWDSPD